jgi:hypothetical protein
VYATPGAQREEDQKLDGPPHVDEDDAAAMLCKREVEIASAEPDPRQTRAAREATDNAVIDAPGSDVERGRRRFDSVRGTEMSQVETVREDHI